VLVTGADALVASGLLLRGLDMSQDTCLKLYEPLAVGVNDPLGLIVAKGTSNTAA